MHRNRHEIAIDSLRCSNNTEKIQSKRGQNSKTRWHFVVKVGDGQFTRDRDPIIYSENLIPRFSSEEFSFQFETAIIIKALANRKQLNFFPKTVFFSTFHSCRGLWFCLTHFTWSNLKFY